MVLSEMRRVNRIILLTTTLALLASILACGPLPPQPPEVTEEQHKALYRAVRDGDLDAIKNLLGEGAPIDSRASGGRTLLDWAILLRQEAAAKLLIDKGADVNLHSENGSTPLFSAIESGQQNLVHILLKTGANSNQAMQIENDTGFYYTPLMEAYGRPAIAAMLLEYGADCNINDAAAIGDTTRVLDILKKDASQLNNIQVDNTPLDMALIFAREDIVKLLVERGAEYTVFGAAATGDHERLKSLLDKDPSQTMRRSRGLTPLVIAVRQGSIDAVEALLQADSPLEEISPDTNATVLHEAVMIKNATLAFLLLEHGANVDAVDYPNNLTPLMMAVASKQTDMVKLFLDFGANTNYTSEKKLTPLILAEKTGHEEIITLLKEHQPATEEMDDPGPNGG
jgi:ankyrin repeat protein